MTAAVVAMLEAYRIGTAPDMAKEFWLPGHHKQPGMSRGKAALAASLSQPNAAKNSLGMAAGQRVIADLGPDKESYGANR